MLTRWTIYANASPHKAEKTKVHTQLTIGGCDMEVGNVSVRLNGKRRFYTKMAAYPIQNGEIRANSTLQLIFLSCREADLRFKCAWRLLS